MNLLDYLRPIQRKVAGMVRRGVVTSTNDGTKAQGVQVMVGDGVIRGPVEYLQPYGFTSQANAGADAVLLQVGGSADLPVCILVSDRRGRVKVLPGEVAQWDDQGQAVALRRDGIVIDAAGRPDGIKLGAAAALGVARQTDPVACGTMAIAAAPTVLPAPPGVILTVTYTPPVGPPQVSAVTLTGALTGAGGGALTVAGKITGGSATVTAAD